MLQRPQSCLSKSAPIGLNKTVKSITIGLWRVGAPHIVIAAVFGIPRTSAQPVGHNPGSPFPHHRKT
jgi:hypothetical protein